MFDKSLRKQFDELFLGKAVHCNTEERAKDFLELAHLVSYEWKSEDSLIKTTCWEMHKEKTFYFIEYGNKITYGRELQGKSKYFWSEVCNKVWGLLEQARYLHKMIKSPCSLFVAEGGKRGFVLPKKIEYILKTTNYLPEKVVFNAKNGRTTLIFGNNVVVRSNHDEKDAYNKKIGFLVAMIKSLYTEKESQELIKIGYERYNVYKNNLNNYFETLVRTALRLKTKQKMSHYQINKLFDKIDKSEKIEFVIDKTPHEIEVDFRPLPYKVVVQYE